MSSGRTVGARGVHVAVALAVVALAFSLGGCGGVGGSAGLGSGGAIGGRVLGNAPGGYSSYTPLGNVYVAAYQVGGMGIIRSTRTNAYGEFVFGELPLGTWRLGFDAPGYGPIPAETSYVTGYSEVGRTYRVSDVYLDSQASAGDSYVVVSVIDSATGRSVSAATVLVGPSSGVTSYAGECVLAVPVRINQSTGQPLPESILVSAVGYDGASASPRYVYPVAHQSVYVTVYLMGYGASVAGQLRIGSFEQFYLGQGLLSSLSISSDVIPNAYLNPQVDPFTGRFTVSVPVGAGPFSLYFASPYFQMAVVGPITPPPGGGQHQLSSSVYLTPVRRDVTGLVSDSSSHAPSGSPNEVVVEELGTRVFLVGGSYYFSAVPAGIPLTFRASVYNPSLGRYETGFRQVTVQAGGASPFNVAQIVTY